jgi:hypothetical protein
MKRGLTASRAIDMDCSRDVALSEKNYRFQRSGRPLMQTSHWYRHQDNENKQPAMVFSNFVGLGQ